MAKSNLAGDTFEQLLEFGKSTAKQTGVAVAQTFNPVKILENSQSRNSAVQNQETQNAENLPKKSDHTPLDFDKLTKNYQNQDATKTQVLRNRLFQLVKSGEDKAYADTKRKDSDQKQREENEKQNIKKQQANRHQQQSGSIPAGRMRRSIFSAKKVAAREQTEVKPASGKQ